MSAADTILQALTQHYHRKPRSREAAEETLADYNAALTGRLRDFAPVFTTSDGSDVPATELRNSVCGCLIQGIGPHTLLNLTELAATHDCQSDARPDFFRAGRTYTEPDGSTDWAFRCDAITTHPENGERTALGWHHFRGQWTECSYGEDDFQIHLIADAIAITQGDHT